MMKSKLLILIGAVTLIWGCKNIGPSISPEMESLVLNHKKVAVLPFSVSFSEEYRKMMRSGSVPWAEQERIAGLDLQKSAFEYLAKRSSKKNYGLAIQDYMTTNRSLEQLGIPFSRAISMDKGELAGLLGVDAVISGSSFVEFDQMKTYTGNNGIRTTLDLYDSMTGLKVWSHSDYQYIRGRFDSPQDLAKRTVSQLVDMLPYKKLAKKG